MTTRAPSSAPSHPRARRRGFSIIEISVALAAVLVVALGLAAIFDSIGKTVATGRRVSRLNQYARMLEVQLRGDFDRMTRDGFLVIRQQFADANGDRTFLAGDDRVQIFEDDERPRPRRVDEIMFFARGEFASQRPSLPGLENWKAKSTEASIYYGHGMIRPEPAVPTVPIDVPLVNEANNFTGAPANVPVLGRTIANNPNRYAKDWILLRKATLLAKPEGSPTDLGGGITGPVYDADPATAAGRNLLTDKECQIAGRPAAPTLFRSVNRTQVPTNWGTSPPNSAPIYQLDRQWWRFAGNGDFASNYVDPGASNIATFPRAPTIASGLVDIATTSLAEIRSYVQGFANVKYDYASLPRTRSPLNLQPCLLPSDYFDGLPPGPYPIAPPLPGTAVAWTDATPGAPWLSRPNAVNFESVDYLHAWMDDAMPTRSIDRSTMGGTDPIDENITASGFAPDPDIAGVATRGTRIRCAAQAPNLLDVLGASPANATEARGLASLRTDAQMLSASNLVVGCSEFSVDWSFGETAPLPAGSPLPLLTTGNATSNPIFKQAGELLFYGPPSYASGNAPPAIWSGVAGFYQHIGSGAANATGTLSRPVLQRDGAINDFAVSERLIYGYSPMNPIATDIANPNVTVPLSVTSYFGYTDPTFNPDLADSVGAATPDGDVLDPGDAQNPSRVLPWEWPRLIRVRVTIADPVDPTNEGTFEFVFTTPAAPQGAQ